MSVIRNRFFFMFASFSLILMAVLIPLYASTMATLRENTIRYNEQVLVEGLNQLDRELLKLTQLGETLYSDQDIRALSYFQSEIVEPTTAEAYKLWRAMEAFNDITTIGMQFATHCGLIFENKMILTPYRSHFSPDDFYGVYVYEAGSDTYDEWIDRVKSLDSMYSFNGMNLRLENWEGSCLVFATSIPLNTRWSTIFFAVLTQSEVESQLVLPDLMDNTQLTLWTEDGTVLLESGDVDKNYASVTAVSSFYRLRAEIRIQESEFARDLLAFRNRLFAALAAYLAVTLLLSLLYARKNARPIHDIVQAVDAATAEWNLKVSECESGYGYINAFIEQADKKLKSNQLSLAKQETLIRENLLDSMLRNSRCRESSLAMFRQYFPDFPECYRMVLLLCQNAECLSALAYSDFQLRLQEVARNYLPEVSIVHFAEDKLLLIQPDEDRDMLQTRYGNLYKAINQRLGYEAVIVIGEESRDLHAFHGMYLRMQFYLHMQSRSVVFMETQANSGQNGHAFACNPDKMRDCLLDGELASALGVVQESRELLRQTGGVSEQEVQQVFYSYRGALIAIEDAYLRPVEELPGYNASANPDENFACLEDCVKRVYDALQTLKQKDNDQFDESLMQWVNNNLENPDLSVALAVEALSISGKTLQNVMHRATGMSFREYVIDKRMEKAKQMLLYTQMPISEIMTACGYASLNAFYKSFKRTFLIPPNEMREKARKDDPT